MDFFNNSTCIHLVNIFIPTKTLARSRLFITKFPDNSESYFSPRLPDRWPPCKINHSFNKLPKVVFSLIDGSSVNPQSEITLHSTELFTHWHRLQLLSMTEFGFEEKKRI